VTVERIDGGKLRCTGATCLDAVVIYPREILAFQNIERQAHALLRAKGPGPPDLGPLPTRAPDLVRMISRPLPAAPPRSRALPTGGSAPPDLREVISGPSRRSGSAPPDLGEAISGPSRRSGSATPPIW
jgi:hypothetical protein